MIYLLAEMNNLQSSLIAFFCVMTLVGFVLIVVDKKRWKAHTNRSAQMMERRSRRKAEPVADEATAADQGVENADGQESKKAKKDKTKAPKDKEFEYEGRIKDRALITIAVLFGGLGELLAMIFCRHKWYRTYFRVGMPILAIFNVLLIVLFVYISAERGSDSAIHVTQCVQAIRGGLCL